MKRSKIFLGMTTGILAVAALVATKKSNFANTFNAYYTGAISKNCTVLAPTLFLTNTAGTPALWGTHELYTYNNGNACTTHLYTTGRD